MLDFLDPKFLIGTFGLIGVFAIVFAESGLFFGFFLPGDSLLFTAGLFASLGFFDIALLMFGTAFSAVLGDSVGYAFGRRVGPAIFTREESFFFKRKYVEHAKNFYDKHGPKTIVLARFIPIVRTFAPIVAGVAGMEYSKFILYNWLGGFGWAFGMTGLGFLLGETVPGIEKYLWPIIFAIIFASFVPAVWHFVAEKRKTRT